MRREKLTSQNEFVNKTVPVGIKSIDRKGKEITTQEYYKLQFQSLKISLFTTDSGTDEIYLSAFLV